jgi:CBS domain containing-hemolysin-like protein
MDHLDEIISRALSEPATAVMAACPLSILPDAPLSDVFDRFSRQSNHPLIVIDKDGTVSGVITPVDLIAAITPLSGFRGRHHISGLDRFLKSTARTAHDLMSEETLLVHEKATISDVLRRMEHAHATSVIIVDAAKKPVGCVELSDIIAYLHRLLAR